jgi:hypothetical protein
MNKSLNHKFRTNKTCDLSSYSLCFVCSELVIKALIHYALFVQNLWFRLLFIMFCLFGTCDSGSYSLCLFVQNLWFRLLFIMVSMSCSTNDIRHNTVPKQWACPAPLIISVTLLFWNSEHVLLHLWHPSHYCSETVSISCSTNGNRHITVPKQWACPTPLITSVTLLFWNSEHVLLH